MSIPARARCLTLAALPFLFAPLGAVAASDAILIYGPEGAGSTELETAGELLSTEVEDGSLPDSSIHVLDLPFPSADPVWIAGDARVAPCTDPALEQEDIPGLIGQAVEQIDALDYEAGRRVLDHAITALPCSVGTVDRTALIDVYYFRGIAAFHLGDRDGARQNFQYALAIDREKTWDTNYPPEPQQVFLLAKEDAIGLDRVQMGIDLAGADVSRFSLDGVAYEPTETHDVQAIPGMHLVQYQAGSTAYSRLVEVRPGGPAALVTRRGLTSAVVRGPDATSMLPAARASLRALVQGRNLKRAYVVVVDGEATGRIYLYDETYTTLTESVTAPTHRRVAPGGGGAAASPEGSPAGITLGLVGYTRAHGWSYMGFDLRGHIRLVGGLEIDLAGGINVAGHEDGEGRLMISLPFVRTGIRYRFGQGRVRPYVGGAFLMSFWSHRSTGSDTGKARASAGGGAMGGLDVHLSDRVYLNAEVTVGYSFALWLAPEIGLGFRF